MPNITHEHRVQIEGGPVLPMFKEKEIKVETLTRIDIPVPRAEGQKAKKDGSNGKIKLKPGATSCKFPQLGNVQFVAIYANGQNDDLKVKVGKSVVDLPLIQVGTDAAKFGKAAPLISVENSSTAEKRVEVLAGSGLPKAGAKRRSTRLRKRAAGKKAKAGKAAAKPRSAGKKSSKP